MVDEGGEPDGDESTPCVSKPSDDCGFGITADISLSLESGGPSSLELSGESVSSSDGGCDRAGGGAGVSSLSVAACAATGISVAACAATGDVCDVESIVWVVGRAAVGGWEIVNGEAGPLGKGGTTSGVVGCTDGEECASPSAESTAGSDALVDWATFRGARFFFFLRTCVHSGWSDGLCEDADGLAGAVGALGLATLSDRKSLPLLSKESEGVLAVGGSSCCDGVGEGVGKGCFTKVAVSPIVEASRASLMVAARETSLARAVLAASAKKVSASTTAEAT